MRIGQRLRNILAARVNDALERHTDPDRALRQGVRDLGHEVERLTATTADAIAQDRLMKARIDQAEREIESLNRHAASALAVENRELARRIVARRIDLELELAALVERWTCQAALSQRLRGQLDSLRARRREAADRLANLTARLSAARSRERVAGWETVDTPIALLPLADLEEAVLKAEARAQAVAELRTRDDESALDELAAAERERKIDEELERLTAAAR